jgi:hypothetical protein
MDYIRSTRRFEFGGIDYMAKIIKEKGLSFKKEQAGLSFESLSREPINVEF